MNKHALLRVLVKLAFQRKLASNEDPHGLRAGLGGAVGLGAGLQATPLGGYAGTQAALALASLLKKGPLDRAHMAATGGLIGNNLTPALGALLGSQAL